MSAVTTDLKKRISDLSPEMRLRLEHRLKAQTRLQPSMPKQSPGESCPLSFSQQRLWFLQL